VPGPVPFSADLRGGLDEPAMADLTLPIKPRSHERSHAGISHERLARRRYAPCPRFWRLLFDPWSFQDTRRLANPEVSDGDVTLGWPWDAADRVFGPYAFSSSTVAALPGFLPDVTGSGRSGACIGQDLPLTNLVLPSIIRSY